MRERRGREEAEAAATRAAARAAAGAEAAVMASVHEAAAARRAQDGDVDVFRKRQEVRWEQRERDAGRRQS